MELGRKGRYSENGMDRIDNQLGMVGRGEEDDLEYSEVLGWGKLKDNNSILKIGKIWRETVLRILHSFSCSVSIDNLPCIRQSVKCWLKMLSKLDKVLIHLTV